MHRFIVRALTTLSLLTAACAVAPDDDRAPGGEASLAQDITVPAGCAADVRCSGAKTCGAWSAPVVCGATFHACREDCGFITRAGCVTQATLTPENRTRACVMHATGLTCLETDYLEAESCPVTGL